MDDHPIDAVPVAQLAESGGEERLLHRHEHLAAVGKANGTICNIPLPATEGTYMWNAEGIEDEERRAELSQATMDGARTYGSAVPIVVWPDGRGRPALSPEECGASIIVVYNSPS
jgi:hypothetical protein